MPYLELFRTEDLCYWQIGGHTECQQHTGDGGVDAAALHEVPQRQPYAHVENRGTHLREAVAKLRPADRNAAVKGIAAVVVALRRTENDRRMARRTVRKDVRPKERHLRRTVLVRQHHFGISGKALVKHNASRRSVPHIQLIDSHLNRPFLVTCEKSKADA